MPKEWILNSANMRWGLTKKKQVGAVSEEIRRCDPKTLAEWRSYYLKNVDPEEHLTALGRKLYVKVSEVLRAEVDGITEEDCIDFIKRLVLERTFEGYVGEKQTIYEQLQEILGVTIEPAPDEWDRGFNVDFYIKIDEQYIGLQIKPIGFEYIPQIINERTQQKETHKKFTAKYGGEVFYIFSVAQDKKKVIANPEVIEEIQNEIKRLQEA